MKIESSNILLSSSRSYLEEHKEVEESHIWVGRRGPAQEEAVSGRSQLLTGDRVSLGDSTDESQGTDKPWWERVPKPRVKSLEDREEELVHDQWRLIEKLIEQITGKKVKIKPIRLGGSTVQMPNLTGQASGQVATGGTRSQGWGMVYKHMESHYEAENTSVSAAGVIKTQDGREINFSLDLEMSREFYSEEYTEILAGDALTIDPLVVNFGGSAAALTSGKFSFDLDADGDEEDISFVRPGSGFLALDSNHDGVINNGSELFGPNTGNGFAELAAYDEDGNGWIDENDSVFSELSVWTKDEDGNDELRSLKEVGVGAIHLTSVGSSFQLTDEQNNVDGEVRTTGIYLEEDGDVKTIQQIDLSAE
jgi:hypothetical protein